MTLSIVAISFLVSWALTRFLVARAWERGHLDIPNSRSSHTIPTPRGGGLAIVVAFLMCVSLLAITSPASYVPLLTCVAASLGIAAVGWLDDRTGLSAKFRLAVHIACSVIAVYFAFSFFGSALDSTGLGLIGTSVVATLLLAWMTNLYNFMDGTDGLAGGQAVSVAVITGLLLMTRGQAALAWIYFGVAAASLGFLVFNWPPARIFMGDVASGFLGFVFGVLALVGAVSGALPLVTSLILLGTFVVDASWTLSMRTFRGEKPWVAHRNHAYQHAAHAGLGHRGVAIANVAINLVWLAPLAWAAAQRPALELPLLALAYAPLAALELKYRAGLRPATG